VSTRRVIDVHELPGFAFGARDPLWWGVAGLIAIESTMFVLCLATYFYVRGQFADWPPQWPDGGAIRWGTAQLILLLVSIWPAHRLARAAMDGELGRLQRWQIVLTVFSLASAALRYVEFRALTFRWDASTYGSIFWTTLGLHTVHIATSVAENLMFVLLLFVGPVEKKHLVDLHTNAFYWYFVAGSWIPLWGILYLHPALLAH
jgi:cytochrome c oxidase subunit III